MVTDNIVTFPGSTAVLPASSQTKVSMALQHLAAAAELVDRTGVELMALVPAPTGEAMLELSLELHRLVDFLHTVYGLPNNAPEMQQAIFAP